jgi:hypothetical protein
VISIERTTVGAWDKDGKHNQSIGGLLFYLLDNKPRKITEEEPPVGYVFGPIVADQTVINH